MRTERSIKGNLHTGFVVKTRKGDLLMVIRVGNYKLHLINHDRSYSIKLWEASLLANPDLLGPDMDIMEIYGLVRASASHTEALRIGTQNRPMLWKRKDGSEGTIAQ